MWINLKFIMIQLNCGRYYNWAQCWCKDVQLDVAIVVASLLVFCVPNQSEWIWRCDVVLVWNLPRQGFGSRWGEIVRGALTLRRDLGVWKLSLLSNLPAFTTRRLLLADRWYITFYCSHLLWLAFSLDTHSLCFLYLFLLFHIGDTETQTHRQKEHLQI